jgi:hypothetical protein
MTVELLLAPECPNAPAARAMLRACLDRLGLDLRVRERVGEFASPTILVSGVDVMTGEHGALGGEVMSARRAHPGADHCRSVSPPALAG